MAEDGDEIPPLVQGPSSSGGAQPSFATRVGKAFAALDDLGRTQDPGATIWQLQQSLVFREGDDDSSENDEREGNGEWEEDLLDLGSSEPFVPTGAFCRGLDREEEFDQSDDLAAHSLHVGAAELMPAKHMEVLDDSSYERAYAGSQHTIDGTSKDNSMAIAHCSSLSSTPASVEATANLSCKAGVMSARESSTMHGNKSKEQPRVWSGIPDYVTHPTNYKCYELDEPLLVGGGVRDSEDQQAYRESAMEDPSRPSSPASIANLTALARASFSLQLPVGSGMAFRPRVDRSSVTAAAETVHAGPLDLNDESGLIQEVRCTGETGNVHNKRQRKFRRKTFS